MMAGPFSSKTVRRVRAVAAALSALFILHPAGAEPQRAEGEPKPADCRVDLGMLLNRVTKLSIRESVFEVDFYVWFRWSNPEIKPHETFELVNGTILSKQDSDTRQLGPDLYFSCRRVVATIHHRFDLRRFPRDQHRLAIMVEDARDEAVICYRADAENSGFNRGFTVPGFGAEAFGIEVVPSEYATNFGDSSLPTGNRSTYSRAIVGFDAARSSEFYSWKLFFGLYISALIGFLALCLPVDSGVRFDLGVAAIFACVAGQIVLSSQLPESDEVTVADKVAMVSTAFVFVSLAQSTAVLYLHRHGKDRLATRLNLIALSALVALYLLANRAVWF